MNYVFIVALLLLVLFAWMDSQQISYIQTLGDNLEGVGVAGSDIGLWENYERIQQPAIVIMWYSVLFAIGVIWFLFSRDFSESLALFVVPATLIFFGVQDVLFFLFSGANIFTEVGAWANALLPIRLLTVLLGQPEPTGSIFLLSAGIGVFLAYHKYRYLKRARW